MSITSININAPTIQRAVLLLSSDAQKNEKARSLIQKIKHRVVFEESESALVPAFEKKLGSSLPAVIPKMPRGVGGGRYYGLAGIAAFVKLNLENEQEDKLKAS